MTPIRDPIRRLDLEVPQAQEEPPYPLEKDALDLEEEAPSFLEDPELEEGRASYNHVISSDAFRPSGDTNEDDPDPGPDQEAWHGSATGPGGAPHPLEKDALDLDEEAPSFLEDPELEEGRASYNHVISSDAFRPSGDTNEDDPDPEPDQEAWPGSATGPGGAPHPLEKDALDLEEEAPSFLEDPELEEGPADQEAWRGGATGPGGAAPSSREGCTGSGGRGTKLLGGSRTGGRSFWGLEWSNWLTRTLALICKRESYNHVISSDAFRPSGDINEDEPDPGPDQEAWPGSATGPGGAPHPLEKDALDLEEEAPSFLEDPELEEGCHRPRRSSPSSREGCTGSEGRGIKLLGGSRTGGRSFWGLEWSNWLTRTLAVICKRASYNHVISSDAFRPSGDTNEDDPDPGPDQEAWRGGATGPGGAAPSSREGCTGSGGRGIKLLGGSRTGGRSFWGLEWSNWLTRTLAVICKRASYNHVISSDAFRPSADTNEDDPDPGPDQEAWPGSATGPGGAPHPLEKDALDLDEEAPSFLEDPELEEGRESYNHIISSDAFRPSGDTNEDDPDPEPDEEAWPGSATGPGGAPHPLEKDALDLEEEAPSFLEDPELEEGCHRPRRSSPSSREGCTGSEGRGIKLLGGSRTGGRSFWGLEWSNWLTRTLAVICKRASYNHVISSDAFRPSGDTNEDDPDPGPDQEAWPGSATGPGGAPHPLEKDALDLEEEAPSFLEDPELEEGCHRPRRSSPSSREGCTGSEGRGIKLLGGSRTGGRSFWGLEWSNWLTRTLALICKRASYNHVISSDVFRPSGDTNEDDPDPGPDQEAWPGRATGPGGAPHPLEKDALDLEEEAPSFLEDPELEEGVSGD
ncbi:collagen alpha-2(I) chain-like [Drosophila bipectinata]|uniref:collagen alpha-2(I) chain-like n=1 Tax=Drosophila bipectinata TaxID=42026 RepID=UPI0038B304E9